MDERRGAVTEKGSETGGEPPHVRQKLVWLSILGFWLSYFALNTLRMAIWADTDQLGMAGRRVFVVAAGILLTYGFYLGLRPFERRPLRDLVVAAFVGSIPACFAYGLFNYLAFYAIDPLDSVRREVEQAPAPHRHPLFVISDGAISWYFFIATWAVLFVAMSYAAKVRGAERASARYRAEAQKAELRALRYQINPHFLFNTLNSLSTLVLAGRAAEAERMIGDMATFYRTSLTVDSAADLPLADEIRLQRLYLDIERSRFPDRLGVVIDVPAALDDAAVPGLILQPLVENAIKHGVARSLAKVTITIRAWTEGGALHLRVEDDAPPQSGAGDGRPGVGLRNVRERIAARFDGAGDCRIGPGPGGGFAVELRIPLIRFATRAA